MRPLPDRIATRHLWWTGLLLGIAAGCGPGTGSDGGDSGVGPDAGLSSPPASMDWSRDLLSVDLSLDLATLQGEAVLSLAPATGTGASLSVSGLAVEAVTGPAGDPLDWVVVDGRLDVGVPPGAAPGEAAALVLVSYSFEEHASASLPFIAGYLDSGGTLLWPDQCGYLYPCKPDPDDGSTFSIAVNGVPPGWVAVHSDPLQTDAPSYMLAVTTGPLTWMGLGFTAAGTEVGVWYWEGELAAAMTGTADLVQAIEFLESTYGPYAFGDRVGPVAVDWGLGGALEHHPFWHADRAVMSSATTHHHEAGHGWFGNGVRLRCWEEMVLSEGMAQYLQARIEGVVNGSAAEAQMFDDFSATLDFIISANDRIAWPDVPCNSIPAVESLFTDTGAFHGVPYFKGALFFRDLEVAVGTAAFDAALAAFYAAHLGEAAGVQDLLDTVAAETGYDSTTLADAWLRSFGRP